MSANQNSVSYEVFDNIKKPDLDDRDYQFLTLSNKLQVLVISDPKTDKSSAALDVHVGHLCDPDAAAGLAHFCEHLLFMGTEKYPSENDYNQYLSEHGGYSNAFTSVENTNYYFEVSSDHLEGALDRFAQFFICPLFTESCTDREMQAVDSEHKKNLQSDSWRTYQLEKDLSSPRHPYRKFGTGNLETLKELPIRKGLDIRKVLLEFHANYYSANIMKLVILGKESLDQLREWALEKFSAIVNKGIDVPSFQGHPLTPSELGKQILVKPVKDLRHMELTFPFPDTEKFYKIQPNRYLSHLIGHEGGGSILSLLKKKGWANSLSAGSSRGGINFEFFKISIDLSQEGISHYEEIILIIFQYIEMIRSTGIQEWIFHECQSLATMHFRFKEKSPPSGFCSRLAGSMHHYAPEDILSGPYLVTEFGKDKIVESLGYLTPDKFRLTLLNPDFNVEGWQKAQWYGTDYTVQDFSEELVKRLHHLETNSELSLPSKNDFIPENFDIQKGEKPEAPSKPAIVQETPLVRMWHKKDDTFWVPKANVYFALKSPLSYLSPLTCVETRLYTDLLKDALNEYSYYAEVAGLSYALENNTEGLVLVCDGYNDKLSILLQKIVDKMVNLKINPERFKVIQEQLARSYRNWAMDSPHQHAMYYMSHATQNRLWTHEEKLAEVEAITPEMVQDFYPNLLNQMHIEGLAHGNISAEEALKLAEIVENAFNPRPLAIAHRWDTMRTHLISRGASYVYAREVPNPKNLNSAIEYYVQVGDFSDADLRVPLSLFSQLGNEPCFDQLRTKEQLGYMVFSGLRKQTGLIGYRVIVQSEKDAAFVESRIEAFLEKMRTVIKEMTPQEFEKHQLALSSKLLEKDKNLAQESSRLWSHVSSRYYYFDQHMHDADLVKQLSKEDVLSFYEEHLAVGASKRRKLSVHVRSQSVGSGSTDVGNAILQGATLLQGEDAIAEVKLSWPLGKGAVPVAPIESYFKP